MADRLDFLDGWTAEQRRAFFDDVLERSYFDACLDELRDFYGVEMPAARIEAFFRALSGVGFKNREMGTATDWAMRHLRQLPTPAEIIQCPELARNFDLRASRREA